ncbi:ABC transporter permease [Pseudahrensia aquimaris]|uniref:ABC transporter permease n=1 Tax=Pseudahrensia aquimaris TaxID=744461 RepID=A0ABW3FKB5_9HYPH
MRIELQKRDNPSALFALLSPVFAMALTMIVGAIMFTFLGKNPATALYTYFVLPLTDAWLLEQIVIKATPLVLIAIGLAVCFRSGNWNIGAEGQYIIGGMFGAIIPVYFNEWNSLLVLPLVLLMGAIGGALYAAVPAVLKSRFGTNEILTSLMLVYVAQQLVDWLVRAPWRNPQGMGFPGTKPFNESAVLPNILERGDAHYGAVFAVLLAVIFWFVLSRTLKGFEVTVLGESPRAGRFAGFSAKKMTVFAFLVSGAMAGLAGIAEVSGSVEKLDDKVSLGYGFTAIIVAFLGRLNPLGIVLAGLVLALTFIGGEEAQIVLGISDRATRVFQGLLLFFVLASDTLIRYRVKVVSTKPTVVEA